MAIVERFVRFVAASLTLDFDPLMVAAVLRGVGLAWVIEWRVDELIARGAQKAHECIEVDFLQYAGCQWTSGRIESAVTPLARGDGRRLSGGCDAGCGGARRRQRREREGCRHSSYRRWG